jgi:NAD(P)-dependent dehydrogenase (short-subunit alcohol dehydrogenase family)
MGTDDPYFLDGRTAIVTGGFGLIGKAVSSALAARSARVTILDSSADRWPGIESEFRAAALDVAFRQADVSELETIPDFVEDCDTSVGGADVWVNCAYPRTDDWGDGPETAGAANWSANVNLQMTSTCLVSSEIAKHMASRQGGSIINIASIYGVVAPDFAVYDGTDMTTPPAYSAIKGGIIAYSRYLASYWGAKGVRVNTVCPGGVFADQPKSFVDAYCRRTPLGRMATPQDIAGPVAFLASDAAGYMTGATLMVDGGWTAL